MVGFRITLLGNFDIHGAIPLLVLSQRASTPASTSSVLLLFLPLFCFSSNRTECEMDRPSQNSLDNDFLDWEHSHGPEFDPDEPPPPYYDPGLIQNQATDEFPRQSVRMPKPCVVPRTSRPVYTHDCLHKLTRRKKLPIQSMEASTVRSRAPTRPTSLPME